MHVRASKRRRKGSKRPWQRQIRPYSKGVSAAHAKRCVSDQMLPSPPHVGLEREKIVNKRPVLRCKAV
eukprot:1161786-Pelagomonas_calceolata.AAC.3